MKAIRVGRFGGPEVLMLETVDDPRPGPGQVLVEVKAAGVNPVETYVRAGSYPAKPALPYTPGSDAAGVVKAVGAGVKKASVGQRVYTAGTVTGAYAQLALCDEAQVQPLADRLSFQQGAAIHVPYWTAFRALAFRARALPGETVLVHGATGGVGLAAVQLARSWGLTVIGTGGTEQGRELVAREGALHVLDHRAPGYLDELMSLTGGRGADVVLEMLANVNLDKDLGVLAPRGRVVVIGSRGTVEIDPRRTMMLDASILGMSLRNAGPEEPASIAAGLAAGFQAGALTPVIGRELPLGSAAEAHRAVIEGPALGKIVLIP